MNSGYDNFHTYFESNIKLNDVPNIFIHGVGLNNTMWKPQKKYFKNESTIYYDLLNHGKSKKGFKEIKFENFNNQLIQLIDYLNIKKFNLIGFSLGSLIAQHFSSKHYSKINKLIIIASVYDRSKEQQLKVKNRYNSSISGKSISDDSIKRWFNPDYLRSYKSTYKFFYNILENNELKNFLPAYKLFVESEKYKINFSKFNRPTLIITGEDDIGSTPEMASKLSKKIYRSKISIIKKARHMVTYEKDNLVNKQIKNFIKQQN